MGIYDPYGTAPTPRSRRILARLKRYYPDSVHQSLDDSLQALQMRAGGSVLGLVRAFPRAFGGAVRQLPPRHRLAGLVALALLLLEHVRAYSWLALPARRAAAQAPIAARAPRRLPAAYLRPLFVLTALCNMLTMQTLTQQGGFAPYRGASPLRLSRLPWPYMWHWLYDTSTSPASLPTATTTPPIPSLRGPAASALTTPTRQASPFSVAPRPPALSPTDAPRTSAPVGEPQTAVLPPPHSAATSTAPPTRGAAGPGATRAPADEPTALASTAPSVPIPTPHTALGPGDATPAASATPDIVPSASATTSAGGVAAPAPSATTTRTASPSPTATPAAQATATVTPSATGAATREPTPTPSATATQGATATASATATPEPSVTQPSVTPSPAASATSAPTDAPQPSPTATASPTNTPQPSPTATASPTNTPQPSPTATASPTNTPQATSTPQPTVSSSRGELTPVIDTYVDSALQDGSFSGAEKLRGDGDPETRILLRFQGAPGPLVRRAVLRLYVLEDADRGGKVHALDQTWDASVTWKTCPTPRDPELGEIGLSVTGRYVEIDVTTAVRADGGVDLMIVPTSKQDVEYAASEGEGGRGPVLIVER